MPQSEISKEPRIQDIRTSGATSGMWTRGQIMAIGSVDMAGIDIGGNKYRLVAHVHYNTQRLYVRWILTHKEYDQWNQQLRQGKV